VELRCNSSTKKATATAITFFFFFFCSARKRGRRRRRQLLSPSSTYFGAALQRTSMLWSCAATQLHVQLHEEDSNCIADFIFSLLLLMV